MKVLFVRFVVLALLLFFCKGNTYPVSNSVSPHEYLMTNPQYLTSVKRFNKKINNFTQQM